MKPTELSFSRITQTEREGVRQERRFCKFLGRVRVASGQDWARADLKLLKRGETDVLSSITLGILQCFWMTGTIVFVYVHVSKLVRSTKFK
jgi:hypothetical protein